MQELDTIITTAPNSLKAAFCCYDVMDDEIEIVVGLLKKSYGILPMTCVIGWSSEVANLLCR